MNERIKEIMGKTLDDKFSHTWDTMTHEGLLQFSEKFAELIVKEMCGMMEQAEDDAYHCFEPAERPTEYIGWLNQWRTRFEKHFGVEE